MNKLLTWLRGSEEPEIELLHEQQARFENPAWRASNSKWTYIVWISLGLYAGLALLVQGARAGSKSTVRLGLIHLAIFFVLAPLAAIGTESFDFVLVIFAVVSLVACSTGIIFTLWSNPIILRWKASKLQIVTARSVRESDAGFDAVQAPVDLRSDGPSSGPRKLDF